MAGHPHEWYEQWVENNGGGSVGVEKLREAVARGDFGEQNIRGATFFLDQRDAAVRAKGAQSDREQNAVAVGAAVTQATYARRAFWLAVAAFAVSLIALGLTGYDLATRH